MGRPLFSGKTLAAIASSEAQPVSLGLALAAAQLEQDQLAAPAVTKHLFEPQHSPPTRTSHLIDEHFLDPASSTGRQIVIRGLSLELSQTARRLVLELPDELLSRARGFEESDDGGVVSLRVLDGEGEVLGVCSARQGGAETGRPVEAESWWPRGGRPQRSESAFETPAGASAPSSRVDPRVLEAELQAMVLRARAARDQADTLVEGEVGTRRGSVRRRHPAEIGALAAEAAEVVEGLFDPDLAAGVSASSAVFQQYTHSLLSRDVPPPQAHSQDNESARGLGDGWAEAARAEVQRRHVMNTRVHDGQADFAWRAMHEETEVEAEVLEIRAATVERAGR